MNTIIQEPWALGYSRLRPDVIRTEEDLQVGDSNGGHCRQDGKKSKKLEVEHHFNSSGITLKKLIPLLESYSESIEHFDHKVKLTVEFIEVER